MQNHLILRFVSLSSALVFMARAIQMFVADSPYRILLWDEDLMKPLLENYFSLSWESWTGNVENEQIVRGIAVFSGLVFTAAALGCFFLVGKNAFSKNIRFCANLVVSFGLILLLVNYSLYARDKSNHTTEFLEYALQWGSPLLLISSKHISETQLIRGAKILTGIVFFSHGLYATGFLYTPANYVSYVMGTFPVTETEAKFFLEIVGIADMVLALLILSESILKYSIYYFIVWGFLTTLARMYCNWHWDLWMISVQQYFHEMLVRFPHFLMPFAIWQSMKKARQ